MSVLPEVHVRDAVARVFAEWRPKSALESLESLTPDASQRRYFRLRYRDHGTPEDTGTVVAMFFDAVSSPEASGGAAVDADDAYVELSIFFGRSGVGVPALLHDAREQATLIIEDLGDTSLASCILGADAQVDSYLDQALDEIHRIQSIPNDPACLAFHRAFAAGQYTREMSELDEFILAPRDADPSRRATFLAIAVELAECLAAEPRVLVHRDFHSWNLLVTDGRVRVIDFQDALLATRAYDLVSLLNDRDMDGLLGVERYVRLVRRFAAVVPSAELFFRQYDRVLLQRDLKVAGRFGKLSTVRGLKQYEQWIPGTLRRIGRTIERIAATEPRATCWGAELGVLLEPVIPEIEEGRSTPLRLAP